MNMIRLSLAFVIAALIIGLVLVTACALLYGLVFLSMLLGDWLFLGMFLAAFVALLTCIIYKEME